jgi:putative redox protein
MNTSELFYQGELRTIAKHLFSGTEIYTDAPLDNHGKAQSFSPTDLLATSLAACMITIMGITCNTHGWEINNAKITVKKVMAADPRRVSEIQLYFTIPGQGLDQKARKVLEAAARACPVSQSLHPDIKQEIVFTYVV